MRKPPTGEPCAGEPPARFGGRGGREPFPTPIHYSVRYSPKTYSEKRNGFRRLLRAFGGSTPVETLKPGPVLAYLQRVFNERSGHAANKERKNLVAAWNYGCRYIEGFPAINPFLIVQKFPETSQPRYVPLIDDFWKV